MTEGMHSVNSMNPMLSFLEEIPDPRGQCNARRYLVVEMLAIALCALLSGATPLWTWQASVVPRRIGSANA